MRIYSSFYSLMNETARDLVEMGIARTTKTMQDKGSDLGFDTQELRNYSACVTNPVDFKSLFELAGQDVNMESWCKIEFNDRINPLYMNPGNSHLVRPEVWNEFLIRHRGKFAYTYNERIRTQLPQVIEALRFDNSTRQAIIAMWNPTIDADRLTRDRVPCSMYYHFMMNEQGKLDVTYNMRSCDFVTHLPDDIYLAVRLMNHIADQIPMGYGRFYFNVSSLHWYAKDKVTMDKIMRGVR